MGMYKLIILIISSNNLEIYAKMKAISQKYYRLYPNEIKYFYIEYSNEIDSDLEVHNDHIFVKGEERGVDGLYYKTVQAIDYINKTYDYEYMLRTNISCFMHLPNILKFIDTLPKERLAAGYVGSDGKHTYPWISGGGIFMSKDVTNYIVTDTRYDNWQQKYDDVIMSLVIIENNIELKNIIKEQWRNEQTWKNDPNDPRKFSHLMLVDGYYDDNIDFDKNILYYRVRNDTDRNNIDYKYHTYLLKQIYNIDI
jgi:hypothetical protein